MSTTTSRRVTFRTRAADDVALGEVRHLLVVHVEQLVHAEVFEAWSPVSGG